MINDDRLDVLAQNAMLQIRRKCWRVADDGIEIADRAPSADEILDVVTTALRMAITEEREGK